MQHEEDARRSLLRSLFPGVADRVDAAYQTYGSASPQTALDEWLDERVDTVLPGSISLAVEDPTLAGCLEESWASARSAAGLLGVTLPEVESFVEAGVDFQRLAEALAKDPEIVPVPAPYGLGSSRWIEAFASLESDTAPRLLIAPDAAREFSVLDAVPQSALPTVKTGAAGQSFTAWTLRLVPAALGPAVLGLNFSHGPHVSLPEMLMLQLMRISGNMPLLDATSFTWLAGGLAQGRLAARHVYDASEQAIRITCREVMSQGPHLGARPPVS